MTMHELSGEAVLIAAGGRSILLQLAHPAIGHAVARHSDFARRPLDRLNGTLSYVYAIACGTAEEAAHATALVNHAHIPVNSPAIANAPAYTAFSPELQLWVAATLYDSAITMHELVYGALDPLVADRIYQEYARLGTALQVPPELWPADRAAFARYWAKALTELTTDATTRALAHELLHSRVLPLGLRLALPLGRLVTAGLLPPTVRTLFRLPWGPRRQRRFNGVVHSLRLLYPRLPARLRHWPRDHYLRALRASMANR